MKLPSFNLLLTLNIISFVDRDMVMRYFGGGIGHLKNAPPQQVRGFDPINPSSESESEEMTMAMEEGDEDDDPSGANEDLGTIVQQLSRDISMGELDMSEDDEDNEDDDDDSDGDDEGGDPTDEDEDEESGRSCDEEEEAETDYGYASP